jgi:DNA mismatch repair protein MutL
MLKILPGHVSNLIAAGEVVQRPASVVKELMENAVDAGATEIKVVIKDSGRTLIQVADNGSGMSREDAVMAFERHATSKMFEIEDLELLDTFGFRGEALASIASVAEVTLRTRRYEDETGTEVKIAESKVNSVIHVAAPVGSLFSVRNLFYNIPARRKFLKSDAAEYRQILAEFTRVALTRPDLYFHFTNNGTEVYNLPPANLRLRIQGILGRELGKELVEISVDTTIVKIKGYIGKPEDARKTPGNQFFFANGRFFRSPYFQKAVLKAYENLIQDGHLPSFFIFLEAEQSRIDVNIHPAKTEVKFEDDFAIFDILHSAVRESLGRNSFMPSIDFDQEGAPEIPKVKSGYWVPPPKIDYDPLFNPFYEERKTDLQNEPLFKEEAVVQKPVLQVGTRYIASTIKSGLMIIDIVRAWERILFERYIKSLSNESVEIQKVLFPVEMNLSETQKSVVDENSARILQLGFEIQRGEGGIYMLTGIPESFFEEMDNADKLADTLINILPEGKGNIGAEIRERIASTLAAAGARQKSGLMSNMESRSLIDTLFACTDPTTSPSGYPTLTMLPVEEIEGRMSF